MATPSHAQAVKSLNKSSGRQRFVFKTFSQRIEDIDIDVYRSLDKVKSEPSEGSSFFRDCLAEWRELNTAEDFISFYEEMLPLVQTLPLVILHKETIMLELLSRLQMKARLSLEPILRLIAALSRDLLEEFLPFLPNFAESLVSLLESGADREPEIIEQIFTSWSYAMMYLQKYLTDKLAYILKVTLKLRYYPKDYVQDFMAEAVSFLFRNAPIDQLKQGVWKIMLEVVKKPLATRKYGVSFLLCYAMRGTSSRLHSKVERVLLLLMSDPVLNIGDKFSQGSENVVEVLILAFQRLCEVTERKELNLMWKCLYVEIIDSVKNKLFRRLDHLLSLLISTVQINDGRGVSDYRPMVDVLTLLLETWILPSGITMNEDHLPKIFDKVLELMLCTLDVLHNYDDMSTISECSLQWAPIFELRSSSLLTFIWKLLLKDLSILNFFRVNILSALSDLIKTSQEEVVYLLLSLFERQSVEEKNVILDRVSEERVLKIQDFLRRDIHKWIGAISDNVPFNSSSDQLLGTNLALLWATVKCVPFLLDPKADSSLLIDLVDAIDHRLTIKPDTVSGVPNKRWQGIIGAAISSYSKMHHGEDGFKETGKILSLARRHRSCLQVLSAVADFLDSINGSMTEADCSSRTYHSELKADKAIDALSLFGDNLYLSEKGLRTASLKILSHYEPLICDHFTEDQPVQKKLKTEASQTFHTDSQHFNVLQLLLLIETTPLSVSTSRTVTLLISKVHMALSAGRIAEAYVHVLLNALIGVFHNRFSPLWDPTSECLAVLLSHHVKLVWDKFLSCFEQILSSSHTLNDQLDKIIAKSSDKSSDLVERFNLFINPASDSTPLATVLSLLLKSLQRIPRIVDSHSRSIVPLFLKFLGYDCDEPISVGSFNALVCRGKEWKSILKEWLNLLKLMWKFWSSNWNQSLKSVLENRLLDANDPEIQMKVLDCLLMWRHKDKDEENLLVVYSQHLKNLIGFSSFREEITRWSLYRESKLINENHRAYLVPIVIRLLMPKVRKLKKHASRKHASINYRKAVLGFLAQLDIAELPLFFSLLIKPLQIVPVGGDGTSDWFWTSSISSIDRFQASELLKYFSVDNITALSWKKRYGFLHVIEDVLGVFDELRIRPFLNFLVGSVVRILGSCSYSLDAAKGNISSLDESEYGSKLTSAERDNTEGNIVQTISTLKQLKELRSFCLKIVSVVLNKYEDHEFGDDFWNLFFESVKPLVDSFKQEGSSSEKPSSLFSCFVAMTRSRKLVPLLYREKNLVPDIFSILTVTSASESILRCVLKFIENLLNLDSELDDEDNVVKRVILPNLEALIISLHGFFQSESAIKRKLVKCPGETEMKIFKLLSKYIKDPFLARKFIDILLPFLAKGVPNSDGSRQAVEVIQGLIPVLGSEITTRVLNAISPLFVSVDRDVRSCLCDLLETVSQVDPSTHIVAKLLHDLNATSATEVGGLDYDTIINAYEKINVDFFYTVPEEQSLLVLSHCVFDMSSEELILRHTAYKSLLLFVEFTSLILGEVEDDLERPCKRTNDGYWTRGSIKRVMSKFLLKHLGNAMMGEASVKNEWINLLREMVLKLPNIADLNSLKSLFDDDAEVDFFNNIVHLQRHRRARALLRFRNVINYSPMAEGIIRKVFVPLFFNMLFEMQEGKGEHVKNACIEALASISGQMKWDSYYSMLMRCFNEINLHPDKQKVLLRLICSILDQFHFSVTTDAFDNASDPGTILSGSSVTLCECSGSALVSEIQTSLQKAVLPKVQKLLESDSDKVNVNTSLAALKILKLLPGDIIDSQLPSIIHRISNFLKNRSESSRDEARCALAACLKELGLEYLQFIVRIMRATLKRGYELHVLGYTLNFILSKLLSTPVSSGKLDYCLEDLLSIVENDILGDLAEEKEVEKIASKMKETRKRKSFETLKLIAQSVTFKSHALKVLSPVTSQLQKHPTPKVKTKLESMLSHIATGIECNPSVDQTDLFIFIFGLIEDGIKSEMSKGDNLSIPGADGHQKNEAGGKNISSGRVKGAKSLCSHLIMVFALGILHKSVKNIGKNDLPVLSMLDPFVALLGSCLNSKYEEVVSAALRCLIPLVRLPLPSIGSQVDKIKRALFDIAQSTVNTSSSLMQSCLQLLTVLLGGTKATLSSEELHLLIQLPLFVDLERNPSFVALSLLKAIVNRKLVVPEIYDLATRVAELMVTSQEETIRQKCSQILLQFLLDYRLSRKRLQQHLDFLLSNLRYEHSSGRLAVLEMLHTIIVKFPKTVLDNHSQTLFIHLVVCLANDQDNEVRSMTGTAIKRLISCISARSLHSILEFSLSWYLDKKSQLWGAAAQVLGLLVEVMKKEFEKHISSLLPRARTIFKSAISEVTNRSEDYTDESTIPFWKEAYYSLIMLEKILHEFPDLCFERDLEDIWEIICELLLHPHMWLRDVSSRLVAFYFSTITEASGKNQEKPIQSYFLMRPSRLFMIAVSFCCQLKAKISNDAASNLIEQNLIFTICGVHSLMGQLECGEPQKFWSVLELNEKGYFLKALKLLHSGKGQGMFLSFTSGEFDKKDNACPKDIRHLLVSNLLKKMGKIALQMEDVQMKIVLNSFSKICCQITQEDRLLYAYEILLPLYKVCEGFAGKVIPDDIMRLVKEVSDRLREKLGIQTFVQVYGEIRKSVKMKRDKRKREEKIMAVVNPERNAKRKLRIAAKHRVHKKRKIMTMKFGRWI